ncbi:glycerophosphodiester phosphodiesterase family protein [Henriciella barbarensis]|uniref:glycerophosphodiester phosphodiesterase family protein n=1 Tax=Henriciella barbarensis TaxID=86342 RepID=UPI0015FD30EE|nr:glycerophosphodiester phosphodiesterase family protein [Henriciella barbarensis]
MAQRFNLLDYHYAHRGLWSADDPPENSLEAILAAGGGGIGCEIDVRPAACGTPVVFHDAALGRMTEAEGLVANHSAEELTRLTLKGNGTFATLNQVLDAWTANTPLLIEMKIDGETDAEGFASLVAEQVEAFEGRAALMSFSRRAVSAIPSSVMKGALILPSRMSQDITLQALVSTSATLVPDFIAAHWSDARDAQMTATDYGLPVAVWTVDSAERAQELKSLPVAQIFECFDPAFVSSDA